MKVVLFTLHCRWAAVNFLAAPSSPSGRDCLTCCRGVALLAALYVAKRIDPAGELEWSVRPAFPLVWIVEAREERKWKRRAQDPAAKLEGNDKLPCTLLSGLHFEYFSLGEGSRTVVAGGSCALGDSHPPFAP